MNKIIVEVCCATVYEVQLAADCGADRIEFNSALEVGGVTPSLAALRLAIKAAKKTGVEMAVMLRPRGGDFCYNKAEIETMLEDARILTDEGSDYIVYGALFADGRINEDLCRQISAECGVPCVFHMAFDETPDWKTSLDLLVKLNFARVLTKGCAASAQEGAGVLREMIAYSGNRIQILPGGGVRSNNVRSIIEQTGCSQIHFSLKKSPSEILTGQELKSLIDLCKKG
ncbi:MAG: copper homeostasis protein CutC [Spirochaetaceae bacterium]|nr:copper homeostasis protein CutC [Spirochaetaceae bacterium]